MLLILQISPFLDGILIALRRLATPLALSPSPQTHPNIQSSLDLGAKLLALVPNLWQVWFSGQERGDFVFYELTLVLGTE